MTHAGRQITLDVTADGGGLDSHAGSALLAHLADPTGLARGLGFAVGEPALRAGSHDRPRVIRDPTVMLADGGDCLADVDLDATLICAHSDQGRCRGHVQGGLRVCPDAGRGEALAGELRPGSADANNAADQIAVAEQTTAQIPAKHIETIEILPRVDSAGASHELLDGAAEAA